MSSPGEERKLLAALDSSPFFYFAGLDRPTEPWNIVERWGDVGGVGFGLKQWWNQRLQFWFWHVLYATALV